MQPNNHLTVRFLLEGQSQVLLQTQLLNQPQRQFSDIQDSAKSKRFLGRTALIEGHRGCRRPRGLTGPMGLRGLRGPRGPRSLMGPVDIRFYLINFLSAHSHHTLSSKILGLSFRLEFHHDSAPGLETSSFLDLNFCLFSLQFPIMVLTSLQGCKPIQQTLFYNFIQK